MRPLIIVRPEPGASATAEAARSLGLQPRLLPLFEVRPIDWTAPDPTMFDALLLTSANALRQGGAQLKRLRSLPAYCVGDATAAAARAADFTVAATGWGGVDDLLQGMAERVKLLHLCGADRREPDNDAHAIAHLRVYEAAEIEAGEDLAALEGAVVALHSPRAAAAFARAADRAKAERARIALAAISENAAAAAGDGWESVEVAEEPSDSAILAIAARLCHNAC